MISFTINAAKNYVLITMHGKPTLDDFTAAAKVMAQNDQIPPSMHRIVDFSKGELDVSSEEVATFAETTRKIPLENPTKTALVARTESERTLLARYAASFEQGDFRVFEAPRDALAWILFASDERRLDASEVRVHRLLGDVDAADVARVQTSWIEDPDFNESTPILWDLRQARLRIEVEDLIKLAEKMQERSVQNRPSGRAAVLVGSKLHESLLKTGFRKGVERGRLRFFYGEPAALEFLNGAS